MDIEQYLFSKLGSEAVEVAHIASKVMEFGMREKISPEALANYERVHEELDDLMAIIAILNNCCGFMYTPNKEAMNKKRDKVVKYLNKSEGLGKVNMSTDDYRWIAMAKLRFSQLTPK